MLDKHAIFQELKKHYDQSLRELTDNPRLRAGAWLVLAILLLQPVFWLQDYRAGLEEELEGMLTHEARIKRTAGETGWEERVRQLEALKAQLDSEIGAIGSSGEAKATFQGLLAGWVEDGELEGVRVRVEEPVLLDDGVVIYRVPGRLDGDFDAAKFRELLEKIESNDNRIVVERLDIGQQKTPRFRLELVAHYTQSSGAK